jgi:hypothetical protein
MAAQAKGAAQHWLKYNLKLKKKQVITAKFKLAKTAMPGSASKLKSSGSELKLALTTA